MPVADQLDQLLRPLRKKTDSNYGTDLLYQGLFFVVFQLEKPQLADSFFVGVFSEVVNR